MADLMKNSGSMYLIDAHALIYQMFHAIPAMNAPDGRPTNAVFGVTRDLLWLHEEVRPDYLLCAFDLPGPTFRDAIYPEYKQHRPPAPVDLHPQVPSIQEVLHGDELAHPFEGELRGGRRDGHRRQGGRTPRARHASSAPATRIAAQLIDDRIRIYSLRKREVFDRDGLLKIWGVKPEQVVDFQTLVGDSVDNVPGVPGVGEKTAAKLLQQYGTLDNLVAHVDEIKQAEAARKISRRRSHRATWKRAGRSCGSKSTCRWKSTGRAGGDADGMGRNCSNCSKGSASVRSPIRCRSGLKARGACQERRHARSDWRREQSAGQTTQRVDQDNLFS